MNATKINTIVTVISIVVTVIFGTVGIWGKLSGVNWYWIPLTIAFLITIGLIVYRRKNFKPKPRLTITLIDINCYIEKKQAIRNNWQGIVLLWNIDAIIEIRNKGWASAHNTSGTWKLTLKQKDTTLTFETKPGQTGRNYDLKRGQPISKRVSFPQIDLTSEHSHFYPECTYCLEYNFVSSEFSKHQNIAIKGKLNKPDWHWGEGSLGLFRSYGYYPPKISPLTHGTGPNSVF